LATSGRIGEHFFTSLGLAPLPQTFWDRSLFKKPRDREVVCHASAWDMVKIGLLDKGPAASADIPLLLRDALDKIAFLAFGIMIDKWRWRVFSGKVTPADYNRAWWKLRLQYQGVAPPVQRSEEDFDPGAKYHIAANIPYMRYFLARILQFQFHRALCEAAGATGPLHRRSIYGKRMPESA